MVTQTKYTNFYGNEITNQQLNQIDSYREIKLIDGIKKEEKVFESSKLNHILYYLTTENVNDILDNYNNSKLYLFHSNEILNGYLKRRVDEYLNGVLLSKSIQVENSDGELVFESELDLNTDSFLESKKYKYFDEIGENGKRNWQYVFSYLNDQLKSIEVFFNNDDWDNYMYIKAEDVGFNTEYFSWDGLEQYQTLEPIIPQ